MGDERILQRRDGRRSAMASLVGGVALVNVAMVGASAMATLVAADVVGEAWSGAPNAAAVLGTALGTVGLSALMARYGRRAGLLTGYLLAAAGAALGVVAVQGMQLALLIVAMAVLGVGQGAAQLSRYAAAELYPAERRNTALSVVVWGGTVGALTGPGLLPLTTDAAPVLGVSAEAGPYLLALLAVGGAAAVSWPLRMKGSAEAAPVTPVAPTGPAPVAEAAPVRDGSPPPVTVALTSMITGQVAMAGVMTMTPVHMHAHGHGLGALGVALTAHTAGMFALAPLSGKLADLRGGNATILAGLGTILTSGLCAVLAPTADGVLFLAAMFLLGYGWNLTFVGGSSLLSGSSVRLQGRVDGLVWGASAVAGLGAGGLMAGAGFPGLVAAACATLAVPAVLILRPRRARPAGPRQDNQPVPVRRS